MEIIILHGWATETQKWDVLLKELKNKGLKPNLLKIPGLTEHINTVWTLDDYVKWLKKKIGNKQVIVLGHSNGGRIALAFANKYPKNMRNLILIDSAGIYHKELTLRLKRLLFKIVAKLGKKLTSSNTLRNIIYTLAGESDYNNADPIQKQTMINLISTDLTPILKEISIPTLIIWGQQDKTTPFSDGQLMHKLIRDSKFEVIKYARHSPQFTNPTEVVKIIYDYL